MLFNIPEPVEVAGPLATLELTFTLARIAFPAPGDYRFQLLAGDQVLMERRLDVVQVPGAAVTLAAPPEGGDEPQDDEGWVLTEGVESPGGGSLPDRAETLSCRERRGQTPVLGRFAHASGSRGRDAGAQPAVGIARPRDPGRAGPGGHGQSSTRRTRRASTAWWPSR
jgi:hypothetical protein